MSSTNIGITELEADNIGGQRSKIDVIATILHLCIEGSLKNHIVGRGNFSDSMANHYISILLYNDLLSTYNDNENSRRTYYRTTSKGKELIYHYNQIQRLFRGISNKENIINSSQTKALGIIAPTNASTQPKSKSILIIDNEVDITSALKVGLERYGFRVDVINNPVSAVANYKPGYYSLLILDIRMPGMDGIELYQVIKKLDSKTKVCFWTAFEVAYEQLVKTFPTINEKYFIKKPIPLEDLVSRIDKIMDIEDETSPSSSISSSHDLDSSTRSTVSN